MNILVTGSNGFVGGALARILGEDNYIIGCGTKEQAVVEVDKYVRWDMGREDVPQEIVSEDIDIIVHAAACLDKNNTNEELIFANCLGTHRIFCLAKEKEVKKVYYISGLPVIGTPKIHPITEEHPLEPPTMYHATKLAGEFILNQLIGDGIEVVNLRVPSPIGPGMPVKTILPIFASNALRGDTIKIVGKGTRRQNYLDVRDLATLIQESLEMKDIAGTYNIASKETVSNVELATLCIELADSNSNVEFLPMEDITDDQVWDTDTGLISEKLNFVQNYTIRDSVADIIQHLKIERDE